MASKQEQSLEQLQQDTAHCYWFEYTFKVWSM